MGFLKFVVNVAADSFHWLSLLVISALVGFSVWAISLEYPRGESLEVGDVFESGNVQLRIVEVRGDTIKAVDKQNILVTIILLKEK